MYDKEYHFFGSKYGKVEYEEDKEEWDYFCQIQNNEEREYFKNDAYCAKERIDAYEKGDNPLKLNSRYNNSGCGCVILMLVFVWLVLSLIF